MKLIFLTKQKFSIQNLILTLILSFLFISCSPKPEPINYGQDVCELCKMNITDNKFAAEIVTAQGKVFKFDSIECLFNYKHSAMDEKIKIHSEWVNDFSNPGQLIDLTKAHFLHNDVIRSPMGLNVLSFSSKDDLIKTQKEYGGKELTYNEVMELAISE